MLEKIKGHHTITEHLKKEILSGGVSHAYLFTGINGVGKKKTALEFAKSLLCTATENKPCGRCSVCSQIDHGNHPDVQVITPKEGETTIKITQVREMVGKLSIKPYTGDLRMIIIDDADCMTPEAQNSLLKSLEEPLSYNLFVLLTTHPQSILTTIRSRCQSYYFHPLNNEVVAAILKAETEYDSAAINGVLHQSGGSPGMGLYLLANSDIQNERKLFLRDVYHLLKGDELKVFALAESLSKDKALSEERLGFLIQWFYEVGLLLQSFELAEGQQPDEAHIAYLKILNNEKNEAILKTLFEMMAILQYNVNLRLQWEMTFIKIMEIQKGYN
ncbi:DNA polymerase III subunit delta' [Acetobacterium bakii]|uniref:DNA polymerase III subunit delta' n=1 Tax=Acetobacterium bakii TaxID=52689 RepID=UPI000682F352|nr:DNA polymerase III subunit delta' [Acetobacterium bakii]